MYSIARARYCLSSQYQHFKNAHQIKKVKHFPIKRGYSRILINAVQFTTAFNAVFKYNKAYFVSTTYFIHALSSVGLFVSIDMMIQMLSDIVHRFKVSIRTIFRLKNQNDLVRTKERKRKFIGVRFKNVIRCTLQGNLIMPSTNCFFYILPIIFFPRPFHKSLLYTFVFVELVPILCEAYFFQLSFFFFTFH